MVDKKTQLILHGEPMWKGIIALAFPVFLVNILKTLHDLIDGVFLGQVPGTIDGQQIATLMQSAIGLVWPVYFTFLSFGIGLSIAGNALIGQYVGKHDLISAKRHAANLMVLTFLLGVLFTALVYFTIPYILTWMGSDGMEYQYALSYIRIRSFELPFLFLSFGFQSVRQSTGDTLTPVLINAFAIITNIILTALFVLVFNFGIIGAAYATLIGNIVMLPFILYLLRKPKTGITLKVKDLEFNKTIVHDILKIALPASSGQAIQAIGFIILNSFIRSFGEAVMAGFYYGNRINSIIMFPALSISTIIAIYIAQNIGADNIDRAKKAFRIGMILSIAMMTAGALLIIPFRYFFVSLFSSDPLALEYAAQYTLFLHIGLPLMAVFQVFLSTFQGTGETKYSLYMAVIRLWLIRLPLVFISVTFTNLGPAGIWYSILISNFAMVFIGMFFYSKVKYVPKIRKNIYNE